MELTDQITQRAREIRTDGYGMSIGEVLSLHRDGDIDIHPEFQRIFRWSSSQKSKLIESILLGIPIPPIFVSQRDDGVWDVIDGVQRLSTILEFVGEYRDEGGHPHEPLILSAGEYLTELEGYSWGGVPPTHKTFSDILRRDFKRAKVDFRIITKESDPNAKYDLFQRLNSGSVLSPQEARNCLLVMIDRNFYQKVVQLAESESFANCVSLSERQESQAYQQELVLRFFCQADYNGEKTELPKEYGEYLTDWMRKVAASGTDGLDAELFSNTFKLLSDCLGEDAFRRFESNRHLGPFSIASFEFVTTGLAHNIDYWSTASKQELQERIESIWDSPAFRGNSGTGVSPRRRVPRLIIESREFFEA